MLAVDDGLIWCKLLMHNEDDNNKNYCRVWK